MIEREEAQRCMHFAAERWFVLAKDNAVGKPWHKKYKQSERAYWAGVIAWHEAIGGDTQHLAILSVAVMSGRSATHLILNKEEPRG